MDKTKPDFKYWIYFLLAIVFAVITFILNKKAYLGILNLFPGIFALLFSFLCLRIAKQKGLLKVLSFLITALSLTAIAFTFVGESGKKHKDKVEFIDEFSKEIDSQLEKEEKDTSFR